jgi:hypothetical protein
MMPPCPGGDEQDGMDAIHDWRIGFQMARDLQGDAVIPFLPEQPQETSPLQMLEQLFDFELGDEEEKERHRREKEHLTRELTQLLKQPGAYQRLRADIRREIVRAWQAVAADGKDDGGHNP